MLANLVRRQTRPRRLKPPGQLRVLAQFSRRRNAICEQLPDQRNVHRATRACLRALAIRRQEAVLGRERWAGRQMSATILNEPCETELRRTFHQRICLPAQELAIGRKAVMLVQMRAEPGTAHLPVGPRGRANTKPHRVGSPPDVDVVVRHPTGKIVGFFGRALSGPAQLRDQADQRLGAVAQVAALHRPVVHLDVDVRGPVTAPRRRHLVVPDALQVGRLRSRSRARNEHVAPILEVEREQRRIGRVSELLQPFASRQR